MSTPEQINYEAVLADLESRKAQLDSAIAAIRLIMGQPGGASPTTPGGSPSGGATPAHDAFIGMSIPEAAKKHLSAVRKKLSTQELMTAMEAGGLPPSKYTTVYGVLRRREVQVGDIINMKGDWALAEWYPNYRPKGKGAKNATDADAPKSENEKAEEVTAEKASA
jgi:hypothetical protein